MSVYIDIECTRERLILDLRAFGFSEVPAIGRYNYPASHPPLRTESHEGLIEVCILEKGEQIYNINEEVYILRGKNFFVIMPGEIHGTGCNPESNGKFYWFFIRPPKKAPFLGFDAGEAKEIGKALLNPVDRLFADGTKLIRIVDRIFAAARGTNAILGRAKIKTLLMELILELVSRIDHSYSISPGAPSTAMSAVLTYINENFQNRLRVEDMAEVARLSVPRFKARFKAEVGFTPNVYLNYTRICMAKEALVSGKREITVIAHDLGYPSSQYFSQVFKKFTDRSPSEYRKDPAGAARGRMNDFNIPNAMVLRRMRGG
jgi:AraC-like DNA-binding protein